jgi:hypothetical protein
MFTYTNKRGVQYFVHEARTKAGARRYVVKRTAAGALPELPDGMEITETVNAQVSIRTVRRRVILPLEERLAHDALHRHSRDKYRIEVTDAFIIVNEPDSDADKLTELFDPQHMVAAFGPAVHKLLRKTLGGDTWQEYRRQKTAQARQEIERAMRYSPVLRFRLDDAKNRRFSVERMTYHGHGGWLWLKRDLTLAEACDHYFPLLGTDELFEEL